MNKLKMASLDITKANIDKIAEMFPQVVTEVVDPSGAVDEKGKPLLKKAIDFEKLKWVLSAGTGNYVVADEERERYEFTWVGKRQAMMDAATPICKTLRPCLEESKDWETTENLYIEGDNLEVLKLLQESYLGKVKMIYIDPPYNTGNDFIYKDNFKKSRAEYEDELDMFDEEGNKLFQNTETNGRFHSDWCSMIYPRLQLARNLLTDDGVIFISIDDNEVRNLKNICDEVFGERNYIDTLHWKRKKQPSFLAKHTAKVMEYVLTYGKCADCADKLSIENISDGTKKVVNLTNNISVRNFKAGVRVKIGDDGVIRKGLYTIKSMQIEYLSDVVYKNGFTENQVEVKARFSVSQDLIDKFIEEQLLFISVNYGLRRDVSDEEQNNKKAITDLLMDWGDNQDSEKEQQEIFKGKYFDYTKPTKLIYNLIKSATNDRSLIDNCDSCIILDFFSGSATTAHAVMQLNAEDGGKRKFMMVQLPEVCDPNSEAAKAGYKTICEIGKERIRRAGEKIDKERIERTQKEARKDGLVADIASLDTGFRVFKTDSTNMKDVYYAAGKLSQKDLFKTESNIKDDRSDIDLLYGCLLDWGVYGGLQMPHTSEQIDKFTVHTVNSPLTDEIDLIACFDSNVSETVVRTIAQRKPSRALFRDSSFADSANKINVFEIFKSISPDTTVKVI